MFDPVNHLFRFHIGRSEWAQIKLPDAPPKREGHSATMTADGQMVIFGGYNGKFLNDVHVLEYAPTSNSTDEPFSWRQIEVAGPLPAARDGHTAVLCPDGTTILVFGGFDGKAQRSDTYALDTRTWTWRKLVTSPSLGGTGDAEPPARCMHCAAWVSSRVAGASEDAEVSKKSGSSVTTYANLGGGMLVYGGYSIDEATDADTTHNDLWILRLMPASGSDVPDVAVWERVEAQGNGPVGGVFGHAATLDGVGRLWVHGGCKGGSFSDELYVLERQNDAQEVSSGSSSEGAVEDTCEQVSTKKAGVMNVEAEDDMGDAKAHPMQVNRANVVISDTKGAQVAAGDGILRGWAWRRVTAAGTGGALPCARHKHTLVCVPPSLASGTNREEGSAGENGGTLLLFGGVERGVARGFYALEISDALLATRPRTFASILSVAVVRLVAVSLLVAAFVLRQAATARFGLALLLFAEQERISSVIRRLRGGFALAAKVSSADSSEALAAKAASSWRKTLSRIGAVGIRGATFLGRPGGLRKLRTEQLASPQRFAVVRIPGRQRAPVVRMAVHTQVRSKLE